MQALVLLSIQVKCLKQGIKKSEFCLKQGRKISDICLKQGQGMRGRAAPPHPEIYRVPPGRRTKVRLYKTLVKPVLMYGCETWKINKCAEKKIDVFQCRCLRRIFKIRWQKRITNKEVLKMAEIENLSEDVRRRSWKFIGHIMRNLLQNNCRTALTCAPEGRRKKGRSRTTWRGTAKREREKTGWKNWSEIQMAAAD